MYTKLKYSKILYSLLFSVLLLSKAYSKEEIPFRVIAGEVEEKNEQGACSWIVGPEAKFVVALTGSKPCGLLEVQPVWGNSAKQGNAIHILDYTIHFEEGDSGKGLNIFKDGSKDQGQWVTFSDGETASIGIFYEVDKGLCTLFLSEVPMLEVLGLEINDDVELYFSGASELASYLTKCRVGSCERWVFEESSFSGSQKAVNRVEEDVATSTRSVMKPLDVKPAKVTPLSEKSKNTEIRGNKRKGPWITLTKIGAMDVSK